MSKMRLVFPVKLFSLLENSVGALLFEAKGITKQIFDVPTRSQQLTKSLAVFDPPRERGEKKIWWVWMDY